MKIYDFFTSSIAWLLRINLVRRRKLFPSFAKGVVRIRHHHKRPWVGLLDFQFHTLHLLVAHYEENHFLVLARVKSRTLDAGSRAVQVLQNVLVKSLQLMVADDKNQFVVLRPVNHVAMTREMMKMEISE